MTSPWLLFSLPHSFASSLYYSCPRFKNKVRIDEIKLLMQGLAGVPKPPLTSEEQLPPAQELPKRAPRPEYATSAIGKETDNASVATTRTFADPGKY